MMRNVQMNGFLIFEDAGQKFIEGKHALNGLTKDCEIFVYSLTPRGYKTPQHLVVKMAPAGQMVRKNPDGKFSGELFDPSEISHVIIKRMDYQESSPKFLFEYVRKQTNNLAYSLYKGLKFQLFYQDGFSCRDLTPEEFFNIDIDPDSEELGAQTFLKDRAYFLQQK